MNKSKKRLSLCSNNPIHEEFLIQNDDEAEKIERRKSRTQNGLRISTHTNLKQLTQNKDQNSPVATKQKSSSTHSSLSNQQLAELYANCLKLCTENVFSRFFLLRAENKFLLNTLSNLSFCSWEENQSKKYMVSQTH
jgi:hypothetical protein